MAVLLGSAILPETLVKEAGTSDDKMGPINTPRVRYMTVAYGSVIVSAKQTTRRVVLNYAC